MSIASQHEMDPISNNNNSQVGSKMNSAGEVKENSEQDGEETNNLEKRSSVDMKMLMEKYSKGKRIITTPEEQQKFYKQDGFQVKFRLSKAYRNLEKQEVLAARPEVTGLSGRRRRKQMQQLIRKLEEDMMLPDPDGNKKKPIAEEVEIKPNTKQKEDDNKEQLKPKITNNHAPAEPPSRRSVYLSEYWGKPGHKRCVRKANKKTEQKLEPKGDWRLKTKSTGNPWWHTFVKKKPKITWGSSVNLSGAKSTPIKVMVTPGQNPSHDINKIGQRKSKTKKEKFFITNPSSDGNSYSAVNEWQRRNAERKINQTGKTNKLQIFNKAQQKDKKENECKKDCDEKEHSIYDKTEERKDASQDITAQPPGNGNSILTNIPDICQISETNILTNKEEQARSALESSRTDLGPDILSNKTLLHPNMLRSHETKLSTSRLSLLSTKRDGSTCVDENRSHCSSLEGSHRAPSEKLSDTSKSPYGFMATIGSLGEFSHKSDKSAESSVSSSSSSSQSSNSNSEVGNRNMEKLGFVGNAHPKSKASFTHSRSPHGSTKAGHTGTSKNIVRCKSVTFGKTTYNVDKSSKELPIQPSIPGQIIQANSKDCEIRATEENQESSIIRSAKSHKIQRCKSASDAHGMRAPTTSSSPLTLDSNEEPQEWEKTLRTCRFLYNMCNCQRVGRENTLSKLLKRRRKTVGVITIYGCPTGEEKSSSVCPFCSVFPRKRIEAWLRDVTV